MTDFSVQFVVDSLGGDQLLQAEINRQAKNLTANAELLSTSVIDSRLCKSGSIFFAFFGDNLDGHDYIQAAADQGARLAIVERFVDVDIAQAKVACCRQAIAVLAKKYRQSLLTAKVIALTGSAGKTSTKDILAFLLSKVDDTQATVGNLNNELGLPLTILNTQQNTKFLILEMGAAEPGDIKYLMDIACPDVGLITNIGDAHIGRFGSRENIAETKTEMFGSLNSNATAIINGDDEFHELFIQKAKHVKQVSFSLESEADVYSKPNLDGVITLHINATEFTLQLPFNANHQILNFLAATACIKALNVDLQCLNFIEDYKNNSDHRQIVIPLSSSVDLIDDTYNSSPAAMKVAIDFAKGISSSPRRLVLIFGAMAELGEFSDAKHVEITEYALEAGFEHFIFCGESALPGFDLCQRKKVSSIYCRDFKAAAKQALNDIKSGDIVLIKGSRSGKLDKAVEMIIQNQSNNNWEYSTCC